MNKRAVIIMGVIIIVLIAVVFNWKIIRHTLQSNELSSANKVRPLPKEVTVTLDKQVFLPMAVTIKVGSAIRWINKSGNQQTVNSNNYPTNQLHKELNFGIFNNNSSVVYTFTKPGTYGYHNQFHPQQKGIVIVQ